MSNNIESEIVIPRVKLQNNIINNNHDNNKMAIVDIDIESNDKYLNSDRIGFNMKPTDMVKLARKVYNSGKTRNIKFRKNQLNNFMRMLDEKYDEMIDVLTKDLHKHELESSAYEITMVKNELYNLIVHLDEYLKTESPEKPFINMFDKIQIYKDPYGVVLVIGAWNYPIQLTLIPLLGAIAAGNCVILKPSEIAANTESFLLKTIPKYLDQTAYQVMSGGVSETTELLDERFDYIFFTGSPAVGKIVHRAASKYLTPCTLELGGKSPVYIDNTADIDIATKRLIWGKCINAGQTCIAPDYLLCTKDVEEKVIECAKKHLAIFYGDNQKVSPDIPRVITDRHFNRLVNFIQNHNVAVGGDFDASDRYIQPTILRNVKRTDQIMEEEIFGPILPIVNIRNVNEFIDYVNAGKKPLAMYIFSKNKADVENILKETTAGGVTVNDTLMHITVESLPFGGVGTSGMGSYHGKRTIDTFLHEKGVVKRNFNKFLEKLQFMKYPPYTDNKVTMINTFMTKRVGIPTKYLSHVLTFSFGILFAYLICAIKNIF